MTKLTARRFTTLIGCVVFTACWGCTPAGLTPGANDDPAGSPVDSSGEDDAGNDDGQGEPLEGDGPNAGAPGDGDAGEELPDAAPPVAGECRSTDVHFTNFQDGEPWILATRFFDLGDDPLLMGMGIGDRLSGLALGADLVAGPGCAALGGDVEMTIEDGRIEVIAELTGYDDDARCRFELSAMIDPCGHDVLGLTVFDVVGDATAVIGEETIAISALQIIRIPVPEPTPCEAPVETLAGRSWSISNTDLSGPSGFGFPFPTGPSLNIWGSGEDVESATWFGDIFDIEREDDIEGCFGGPSDGTVSFDGQTLTIDLEFDNEVGGPPCVIEYTGAVASCTIPGSGGLFGGFEYETGSQVLRIDGTGRFAGGGLEGELTTLYVNVFEPYPEFPSAEPCGDPPQSLEGQDWYLNLSNAFGPQIPPESFSTFLSISGHGETLGESTLFVDDFENEVFTSCFDLSPEGAVRFDGETFSIDVQLSGADFDDPYGGFDDGTDDGEDDGDDEEAPPCSVSFTGHVVGCSVPPGLFGPSDRPGVTLLEFEGEGEYVTAQGTVPITTMFMSTVDPS